MIVYSRQPQLSVSAKALINIDYITAIEGLEKNHSHCPHRKPHDHTAVVNQVPPETL
jgi:hypothetical protein